MDKLIRIAIERPVAVIMALGALLLSGLLSIVNLPLERMPRVHQSSVTVEAEWEGLGAGEIRSLVALPLEAALYSVNGLSRMTSVSREGKLTIALEFSGEDEVLAALKVREAVDAVFPSLPAGLEKPLVRASETWKEPLLTISLNSRSGDLAEARRLARYSLTPELRMVEGVSRVSVLGGREEEVLVTVDPGRLSTAGLSVADLARDLSRAIVEVPAGKLREGEKEVSLVASGRPSSLGELSSLVLQAGRLPLRLSDSATAVFAHYPPDRLFVTEAGETVGIEVYLGSGADPVSVSRSLHESLAGFSSRFNAVCTVSVLEDASTRVRTDLSALAVAALLGALLSIGTVFLFLGDLRASLLSGLAIPLCLSASSAALCLAGRSLNSLSLGGIALGVGLLGSNTVVVLSAILDASRRRGRGRLSPEELSLAVSSVTSSTFAGTMTTIIVFAPVLFATGVLGALFFDVALSLIAAVLSSWFLAVFAIPALYSLLPSVSFPTPVVFAVGPYRSLLGMIESHPGLILVASFLLSLSFPLLLPQGGDFSPAPLPGVLEVEAAFPTGTSREAIGDRGAALASSLGRIPGVVSVCGSTGAASSSGGVGVPSREQLLLRCALGAEADAESLERDIAARALAVLPPGSSFSVAPVPDPVSRLLSLSGSRRLTVSSSNREQLLARSEEALALVKKRGGDSLESATLSPVSRREVLRIHALREQAAVLGRTLSEIAEGLLASNEGLVLGELEFQGRSYPLRLKGRGTSSGPDSFSTVLIASPGGSPLSCASVARGERYLGWDTLVRINRSDALFLEAVPVRGRGADLDRALSSVTSSLPFVQGSQARASSRYASSLRLILVLVVILLYLLLAAQSESFFFSLLILSTLPLALSGALTALRLSDSGLDPGALLALVVLFGTAVNNPLVIHEKARELSAGGMPWSKAAMAGAVERLNATLVTSLTTVLALIPILVFAAPSSPRSMALVLAGGTVSSTLQSLILSPLLFSLCRRGTSS